MRSWLWLCLVGPALTLTVSERTGEPDATPEKLAPTFPDLKILSLTEDMMSGELSFEKAYLEFTDHMNGYGVYLAHSCDEYLTLLEAQSDAQNPNQATAEHDISAKEEAAAKAETKEEVEATNDLPRDVPQGPWDIVPENLIPIGWKEQMKSITVPSMVNNALQSDVDPFLKFLKSRTIPRYSQTFSVNVPSIANVIVIFGGEYRDDPAHNLKLASKLVPKNSKPKTIFIPLSKPIILPIRKESEKSLYFSPIDASFQGKVEGGVVNGDLTFAGAFFENALKGYYVLFGTGPRAFQRIGTEFSLIRGIRPIGRQADGRYRVNLANVQLAPHATHILVFGGHPHNCNRPAAVNLFPEPSPSPIVDSPIIPDNTTVTDIQFVTSGVLEGRIRGTLRFSGAKDATDIAGYILQFHSYQRPEARLPLYGSNPLYDFVVQRCFSSAGVSTYALNIDEIIPRGAKYLSITGFSRFDPSYDPKDLRSVLAWATPAFVAIQGQ